MKNYRSSRFSLLFKRAGCLVSVLAILTGCFFYSPSLTGVAHADPGVEDGVAVSNGAVTNQAISTFLDWPTANGGYVKHEWTISPQVDPSPEGYYWANQVGIQSGPTSYSAAYAGLQTLGSPNLGKIAIFSIFGGIEAETGPTSIAVPFTEGVQGFSLRQQYAWKAGVSYKMTIALDTVRLANGQGRWWTYNVKDLNSGINTYVGSIKTPSNWGNMGSGSDIFTEHYSPDTVCSSAVYANNQWYGMSMTDATGAQQTTFTETNGFNYYLCTGNSLVTDVPLFGAIYHEMGLNNSHSTVTFKTNGLPNSLGVMNLSGGNAGDCGATIYFPDTCRSTGSGGALGTYWNPVWAVVNPAFVPSDYVFTSWSGLCNGYGSSSGGCSFYTTNNQNASVTANFSKRAKISIQTSGAGNKGATFSSAGGSIGSCGSTFTTTNSSYYSCRSGLNSSHAVEAIGNTNGTVKIYPTTPPAGYHSVGWSGDCLSVDAFGGCAVYAAPGTVKSLTALFAPN